MAAIKITLGQNTFNADVETVSDIVPLFHAWLASQEGTTGLAADLTDKAEKITETATSLTDVAVQMDNTAKE